MNSPTLLRYALLSASVLAVLGCGKKDEATLLTYVPADTAYVFATIEPMPKDLVNAWLGKMGPVLTQYDVILSRIDDQTLSKALTAPKSADDVAADDDEDAAEAPIVEPAKPDPALTTALRVAREVIKDLRTRTSIEKFEEIGFSSQSRSAVYAVGMLPVLRADLGSVEAFRGWVARIEQASGAKFATAKLGNQDLWIVPGDKIQLVLAIEDKQLVATVFPAKADDALKQRLLGLTKPEKSLAGSGELTTLIKTENYLPQGAGWLDLRRLFAQYASDPGMAALAASLGDDKIPELTADCRSEIDGMIAKMPRMIGGYTELSKTRMDSRGRFEMAAPLAGDLLALFGAPVAAGGNHPDALLDFYMAMPVLKGKDFLLKQAKAIVATPYRCESLASLNTMATESVEKLSQMLPPPFSDITGLRVTIDSLTLPAGDSMVPDVRGKVLVASENPSFMIGLAQMAVPSLASVVLKPDAKPVEIATKDLPMGAELPPVHIAMAEKALALSFGKDEAASLGAYVSAPAGAAGDWIKTSYSADMYKLQADFMAKMQDALPDTKTGLDPAAMTEINRLYAELFKRFGGNVSLSAKGIEITQQVELKP